MAKKQTQLFNYIARPDGGATVLLYGDVGQWGDVNSERVVSELIALGGQHNSIDIHINSTGGDVFSGIAIYNALRQSKANITIYIDGLAASIAGVIALCGKPLYMSQYARLMIHKVSGGAYGSAKELRETADLIEQLDNSLAEMIAERIKMTKEEVHSKYFADGVDHWLTAQEALNLGIIDGIHDLPEESDLSQESSTEDIYKVFNNRLNHKAQTPQKQDMALLDDIKAIPQFQNATDSTVVALIKEQSTKYEAQNQALAQLQNKIAELEAKELEALLNSAVLDGRIKEEQKPTYLNLLKSDRQNTEALLNSLPKSSPQGQGYPRATQFTQPQASAGGANSFHGKSWRELDEAGLLAEYKEQDPQGFANAYKAEFGVEYRF